MSIFFLLVLATTIQFYIFITRPNTYQFKVARDSVFTLISNPGGVYGRGLNRDNDPMYQFAHTIDNDIPKSSKLMFINDADDGSELEKYFRIKFWMPTPREAGLEFKYKPNKTEIVEMMKRHKAEYLVTYNGILPTYSLTGLDSTKKRGKLFKLKGDILEMVKEHD